MITFEEMTFSDYMKVLRRRKWLLAILLVLGPIIGYAISHMLPKRYISQSLLLIEQQQIPQDFVQSVVPGALDQRVVQIMQSVLSQKSLEAMIERFGITQDQSDQASKEERVTKLRDEIAVTPVDPLAMNGMDPDATRPHNTRPGALSGFAISVTYSDPSVAQQMCADITSSFIEENLRLREQSGISTTNFLERQLQDAKRKLDDQDQELAKFKSKHIGQLPEQEQLNTNLLLNLNTQLDSTTQALDRAQQDKVFLESMLAQQIANWKTQQKTQQSLNSPETIETQLAKEQIVLADREARYTSNHPDVIAAKKALEELKKRVEESKASASQPGENKDPVVSDPPQIAQLRGQVHQAEQAVQEKTQEKQRLQKEISIYKQRVQSTPIIEQQYKDLTRDHDTALKLYNDLLAKQSESQMANDMERRQEGERFRVMVPANLPTAASFPQPLKFAGGGFAGALALAICLVLLLEARDHTLRTERDVEMVLQLPVLAQLPIVEAARRKKVS